MCAATVCLLVALRPPPAAAGDPTRVWKTVETEHFVISYYEPLGEVARRVGLVAERAHKVLVPAFGHAPADKTLIIITDDTDGSNGFANVLPRNAIHLFASAPQGTSSLADHDDWLYGLTAHEYVHILHLDTIGGLPAWVNRVVGKTWAPNQVQPRWIIEGIATYEESKRSSSGRTRNALFDMDLRVHTLAGKDLDLDAITGGPRAWPQGSAAYQYGSHFLKYVFDRYGDDKLRAMSHDYGSNPIPWGVNKSITRATGRPFTELYQDWRRYRRDRYAMQLEAIERRGRMEGRRLTFSGQFSISARYSKDGKLLLWEESDGIDRAVLRAMPVGGTVGDSFIYADIGRLGDYDVLADGSLVVQTGQRVRAEYDFQDLQLWDIRTRELTRLTHGARARGQSVSPDERRVAFAMNGEASRTLAVMPLRPEAEPEVIWRGADPFDQVSTTAWSPDGSKLAFGAWLAGGYRDILIHDFDTGESRALMHDRAQDIDPEWDPNGRYLYYASDRTGVFNIYAYELATERTYQVTNVLGCAVRPVVSRDGTRLTYEGSDVGGYDLFEIELHPTRWLEPLPYINDRPDPVDVRDDEAAVSAPRPYRALETLAPQSYELQLSTGSFGQAATVRTQGSDMAGHHGYSLATTIGLDQPRVAIGASYSYRRLWPDFRLAMSRTKNRRGGVILDGQNTAFTAENWSLTTGLGLPVLQTRNGEGSLFFDYDFDRLHNREDAFDGHDPSEAVPVYPATDIDLSAVALRFNYSDTQQSVHTLGAQEGIAVGGSLRMNHPALGSEFRTLELRYSFDTYRRLGFLGVTPVVFFHLGGGLQTSDRNRSGSFVLGGVPEQDLVTSVVDNLRAGRTGFLRGFPARVVSGRQFHLMNVEYRQELWDIEKGLGTLPFFVKKLHLAALLDAGDAFNGELDLSRFKVSAGAALRLNMVFGYFVPGALDLGYSRGLTDQGINEFWALLTGNL